MGEARTRSGRIALGVLAAVLVLGVIGTTAAEADNYGIIFSGGIDAGANWDRYYNNTIRIWDIWVNTLGYDVDKVYVLAADGTDPGLDKRTWESIYSDSDWSAIVNAGGIIRDGSPTTLHDTIQEIIGVPGQTAGPFTNGEDCFHFWSFDHGGNTNPPGIDSGVLCGWGGNITDDEFASWVAPIDGYAETYALGQCYAGSMVNDLQALPDQDNRFYAWAADWYEPSYGDGWVDAWADAIVAGLRTTWEIGDYAMNNDPFRPGAHPDYTEHPGWTGDNLHIITNQAIPEPGTLLLVGLGAGLLAVAARRRKK
jgi:hypothetical protein